MKLPYLNELNVKRQYIERFGGINRSDGTPLGEWEELCNMDFSDYPALSSAPPKGYNVLDSDMTGCVYKNGALQYTVPDGIYIDGTKYPLQLTEGEKRLICMGAYIIILPDYIVCNTAGEKPTFSKGADESSVLTGTLTEVNRNWTDIANNQSTKDKLMYLLVSNSAANSSAFSPGDKVLAKWTIGTKERSGFMTVQSIVESGGTAWVGSGKRAIVFETDKTFPDTEYLYLEDAPQDTNRFLRMCGNSTIRKYVPDGLEFVIEHNNRLWACSSENHEIYCSKLGDPFCWGDYQGISTDSWTVTVGSDGDFTGSAVYNGKVLFFKEDCVHVIYGSKAANFTLSTIKLRGVMKGCNDSLCTSNGLLYYKAPEGIFAYNGSTSQKADAALGEDIVTLSAGCADDRKIYMLTPYENARVFDCLRGCWSTESVPGAQRGFNVNGNLYALCENESGKQMKLLSGTDSTAFCENSVEFYAQTGWIGKENTELRHFSKIKLALGISGVSYGGLKFRVLLKYGDHDEWAQAYSFDSEKNTQPAGLFIVPIIPRRCQKIKLRIEGEATCNSRDSVKPKLTLYSLSFDVEEGTEIGGEH